jgi:hypothetical protein
VTKRTPLEKYQKWFQKALAAGKSAIEADMAESEELVRVMSDASLSRKARLARFKRLQSWPRIVLGLYDAELGIAQRNRKEKGRPEWGREEPSETAEHTVGDAVGLGADSIHKLCIKGRLHLNQGLPPKPKILIAEFNQQLSITLSESEAASWRQLFHEEKKLVLSAFERRFTTPMRPLR